MGLIIGLIILSIFVFWMCRDKKDRDVDKSFDLCKCGDIRLVHVAGRTITRCTACDCDTFENANRKWWHFSG